MRAHHNHQLDQDGVDFLVFFKTRSGPDGAPFFIPMAMPLQVKTSDDSETVGVVLPLGNNPSPKIMERITGRKMDRILKHQAKHDHISCILFVGRLGNGKRESAILEDIWREIKVMKGYIRRYRFPYFR